MQAIMHKLLPDFTPNFRPSTKLLWVSSMFAAAGFAIGLLRSFQIDSALSQPLALTWLLVGLIFLVFALLDLFKRCRSGEVVLHRTLPQSFALNKPQKVTAKIENRIASTLKIKFNDVVPQHFESTAFPLEQAVGATQIAYFEYTVIPKKRGLAEFEPAYLLVDSPRGLWQSIIRSGARDSAKVYPDFSAVSNSFVLGVDQAMRHIGAHIAQRKGDGLEFNQLREFRDGDTLKQIDWKATAKLGVPISREFREERDQNIVFLLDCSRRMRAMERDLSYFDYALNALLMSSYIALDKGDAVGVMTFSGEASWLPPVKGKASINQLLNHLYALTTSTQSSDYVAAAENLMLQHRKRSLVILMTNVRDEDDGDLSKAVRILSKNHLVMVVALQETAISEAESMELKQRDDVVLYAGIKLFQTARNTMLARLRAQGVSVVDATYKNLHVQLVNEYLRLKHSGRI